MEKIAELKFTGESARAHKVMKKALKYNMYERKDEGLVSVAIKDGLTLAGSKLDEEIIKHYIEVHNSARNVDDTSKRKRRKAKEKVKRRGREGLIAGYHGPPIMISITLRLCL